MLEPPIYEEHITQSRSRGRVRRGGGAKRDFVAMLQFFLGGKVMITEFKRGKLLHK